MTFARKVIEFNRNLEFKGTLPAVVSIMNPEDFDTRELERIAYPFILETLKKQIGFGVDKSVCYCPGTGKNENFLRKLNKEHHFFDEIVALEHPRYIMQYRDAFGTPFTNSGCNSRLQNCKTL
jgi:hypothetical protein